MAMTPTTTDGTTDGDLLMATGAVAGALMAVSTKQADDSVIGAVEVETDENGSGLATNVLNVELYGETFKVTVEHGR